jgi:hypothetical protein
MKRIIFLGLVLVSLVGCSGNARNDCPIVKVGNKVSIAGYAGRGFSCNITEISGRWFKGEEGKWWNIDNIGSIERY